MSHERGQHTERFSGRVEAYLAYRPRFPRGIIPFLREHGALAEGVMLAVAAVGVVGGAWNRIRLNKGIGLRFVQYLGITVLIPVIAILSLEDRISQEMTGAIAAAAVGAVLAGIGKEE